MCSTFLHIDIISVRRVVKEDLPKIKPKPFKSHKCAPRCARRPPNIDNEENGEKNAKINGPLMKPLLEGWSREVGTPRENNVITKKNRKKSSFCIGFA
ncbi:MAG: hypothetical protein GY820_40440 [Gammaproteobacteria bacterium]|nr:hypothetical protein [Gammaproteobacteria bacterium]